MIQDIIEINENPSLEHFPATSTWIAGHLKALCLGPILFNIYSSQLFDVKEQHPPHLHDFTEDTKLYLSFRPDGQVTLKSVKMLE